MDTSHLSDQARIMRIVMLTIDFDIRCQSYQHTDTERVHHLLREIRDELTLTLTERYLEPIPEYEAWCCRLYGLTPAAAAGGSPAVSAPAPETPACARP